MELDCDATQYKRYPQGGKATCTYAKSPLEGANIGAQTRWEEARQGSTCLQGNITDISRL